MLVNQKTLNKFIAIENRYENLRYKKVGEVPVKYCEPSENHSSEPQNVEWKDAINGTKWGDNFKVAWFKGDIVLPDECIGEKVLVRSNTGTEGTFMGQTLFIVDGEEMGIFDKHHKTVMMTKSGIKDRSYHLAFEAYAGNELPGTGPDENNGIPFKGCRSFNSIEILLERDDVTAFVYDFKVLRLLTNVLDNNSLRKNKIIKGLVKVFEIVDAMPMDVEEEQWRPKLKKAREVMKTLLEAKNGSTTPFFGIVGHSHIDTAWLWTLDETWRKCARTFSSALNLMEQYPDFKFMQSAPCHVEIMKEKYPSIYKRIKEKVKEGRWEPNGAMYIEPDCNIPSGEAFVRQLLIGQKSTRKMFGYTSDILWLPDVFGYSAALPQILKECNVDFFCTTKLSWNDTNRFPYDTFVWKGIDGSEVLSHFFHIDSWPDPESITTQWNYIENKDVQDKRLMAMGYGDGGGGPLSEMIEISQRVKDLEGCPKVDYINTSEFMNKIKEEFEDIPVWNGELYLELHRGTLTSIADIKRLNRKSEVALRDSELLCTMAALKGNDYPKEDLEMIWKKFLINQFHDILPGSSIAKVNDEAIEDFNDIIKKANKLTDVSLSKVFESQKDQDQVMILNNLSWEREKNISLENIPKEMYPISNEIKSQWITDIQGIDKLIVSNLNIPAFGSKKVKLAKIKKESKSLFTILDKCIETPFYSVKFDNIGGIEYLFDKNNNRNIAKEESSLNTFWIGEDAPDYWSNWDIDSDQELKMKICTGFISREIIANGDVQLRLRSHYNIGRLSKLVQDIIFYSDNNRIDFETKVEWEEKHQLLKVGFPVDILCDKAKSEIQYGFVDRASHRNLSEDRARFEVCNHKWTDISEEGFGVALLNDCKYGISIHENEMKLTLLKSSLRPDPRGDKGTHYFTYSLLPHKGRFSVKNVTRPAYELNIPVISTMVSDDVEEIQGLIKVDNSNIIVESIKWAEDGQGFIIRLYEAGKSRAKVNIALGIKVKEIIETNMLEEPKESTNVNENKVTLEFKPFQIKTLYCRI